MVELPTDTVTFLFTDLEGSTRLWEEHPEAMRATLARHDEILRDAVEKRDGVVVKTTGDGLHAVFASARNAVATAVDAQLALGAEAWMLPEPLRVRMGLHTGEADLRAGDYYGPPVNRAARVSAAGHGGQILVSHATEQLVRDDLPEGAGLIDLGEQRLRDLARPERVFQVVHSRLASEFPPVRSLDAFPTNLPAQRTSFVGREREVADIAAALASARLVTLSGVGGVGKTRLALQVAAEVLPHRADGVWLCELAPVSEPDSVLDAVASAVRATTSATGVSLPTREVLAQHLGRRELLLVLDNCEHVLAPVAELVNDLLDRCPGVSVLATSREGLGVPGEQMVAVGTMNVPADDAAPGVARAGDAVQLFADRATAAKRDFVLTDGNIRAVVEVCRRLDGIPLAIELAAARTQMFTPAQIAERLDECFRLLTGSRRGTASRHQTLRAAIDWSYDQLDETERAVLARLAVFSGDFDFDAAEAVAAGGDVDPLEVLDVLGQLVSKSLVVATESSEVMSLRLLETIRQYAEERLEDAGKITDTRTRHAYHYLERLERAASEGGDALAHTARDTATNVQAAHEWFVACADADGALRLQAVLALLQSTPGVSVIGAASRAEAALVVPGAMRHPLAPHVLAASANLFLMSGGDPVEAFATAQRSLALADEIGIEPSPVHLVQVAAVAMRSFHIDEAREIARRGIDAAEKAGDDRVASFAYSVLSNLERIRGDSAAAVDAGERAAAAARRFGGDDLVADALLAQGAALRDVDPQHALLLLDEAAIHARAVSPESHSLIWTLQTAGLARLRLGDTTGAQRDFDEAFEISARIAGPEQLATGCASLAAGLLDVGDTVDARAAALLLAAAEQLFAAVTSTVDLSHDDLVARLEAVVGAETVTELRAEGAAMDFDETVALARSALARVAAEDEPLRG